jgi:hypothetical protein
MTRTRTLIAALIYWPINAVLFGIGAITVLSVGALREQAWIWIPVVVVLSFVLAIPIARVIVPRMRSRRWAERNGAA